MHNNNQLNPFLYIRGVYPPLFSVRDFLLCVVVRVCVCVWIHSLTCILLFILLCANRRPRPYIPLQPLYDNVINKHMPPPPRRPQGIYSLCHIYKTAAAYIRPFTTHSPTHPYTYLFIERKNNNERTHTHTHICLA